MHWVGLLGGSAWLLGLALLPAPLPARITLAAPLLLVPSLLQAQPAAHPARRLAGWPALLAALPLLGAFAVSPGPLAAVFAVPWLLLAAAAASMALVRGVHVLPDILRPTRWVELGGLVALAFLAVGAVFLVCDRLGYRPLGFPAAIVLLTGTHFHFAGFGLTSIAALQARRHPRLMAAVGGLLVGIPLTAAGFVLGSDAPSAIGALLVGGSGIPVALALVARSQGSARWFERAAGACLLVGLPLGIAWSWSAWLGIGFLDLDTMVRTHGALNATGVLLAGLSMVESR